MARWVMAVALAGCVAAHPPGFSSGDSWTLPLVDPLTSSRLLVPVYLHGTGPYLFALDPDGETLLDAEAASAAGIVARSDLGEVRIGDLTVSSVPFHPVLAHALDTDGRRIVGTIGREVIGDSVVFGFDRARGIAWLRTARTYDPPDAARALAYDTKVGVPRGPLVEASIDGSAQTLLVDLGRAESRLRRASWQDAKLTALQAATTVIDDLGRPHRSDEAGLAARVTVAGIEQWGIRFVPFEDERYLASDLDGTLGLGFFRPFTVALDRDRRRIYLTPRADAIAARADRLARWSGRLGECMRTSCIALELEGTGLRIVETAQVGDLQLVLRAHVAGRPPLPDLEANLPAGTAPYSVRLPDAYHDATLEILDASPFPRTCAGARACVVQLPAEPVDGG